MSKSSIASIKSVPGEGRRGLKPSVVAYKRARILAVASTLFYARGYEAATLEMVADQLNVTKPFLYTYFRNKGDILSAICEVGVSESLVALDRVAAFEGTSVDRLRAALIEVSNIVIDRFEYIVVYQREMMNLDRADAQRLIRLRHEFDLRIGKLIEACQRDGWVTLEEAAAMSVWIGGLISWITYVYRPGGRRTREMIIDQVVGASMRMIGLN
jgi:AcrR family transcriptional regulator